MHHIFIPAFCILRAAFRICFIYFCWLFLGESTLRFVLFMKVEGEGGCLYQHVCAAFACGLMAYVYAGDLDKLGWVGEGKLRGGLHMFFCCTCLHGVGGEKVKLGYSRRNFIKDFFQKATGSCEVFLVDRATQSSLVTPKGFSGPHQRRHVFVDLADSVASFETCDHDSYYGVLSGTIPRISSVYKERQGELYYLQCHHCSLAVIWAPLFLDMALPYVISGDGVYAQDRVSAGKGGYSS